MTEDSRKPPKIEGAPGLSWRARKIGWEARWRPRSDLARAGYTPKMSRLWIGLEPSEVEVDWIVDRCHVLQDDMLMWGRGGIPITMPVFDGSVGGAEASALAIEVAAMQIGQRSSALS